MLHIYSGSKNEDFFLKNFFGQISKHKDLFGQEVTIFIFSNYMLYLIKKIFGQKITIFIFSNYILVKKSQIKKVIFIFLIGFNFAFTSQHSLQYHYSG
jgi:hypothetical protein